MEGRLALWKQGDIASLLQEGKCIQDRLLASNSAESKSRNVARHFDHLMSMGKVSAAVKLLLQSTKGDVLSLDSQVPCDVSSCGISIFKSVQDILSDKHPSASAC